MTQPRIRLSSISQGKGESLAGERSHAFESARSILKKEGLLRVQRLRQHIERTCSTLEGGDMEMKELIKYIAKALVDKPEEVVVTEIEGSRPL